MSEVLNLPRAARRLGVTAKWLRDQADGGKVPCLRAGRRYLFDLDALEKALAREAARKPQVVPDAN
jgi:excisionase family DNA binding protein